MTNTKMVNVEQETTVKLDVQEISNLIEAQLADASDDNATMFAFQSKSN